MRGAGAAAWGLLPGTWEQRRGTGAARPGCGGTLRQDIGSRGLEGSPPRGFSQLEGSLRSVFETSGK